MSYYNMNASAYRLPPPGTPGWELAPVPGWGMNPERSGPRMIATNGLGKVILGSNLPQYAPVSVGQSTNYEGDKYYTMTAGHVAMAGAGGLVAGVVFSWIWWSGKKKKSGG